MISLSQNRDGSPRARSPGAPGHGRNPQGGQMCLRLCVLVQLVWQAQLGGKTVKPGVRHGGRRRTRSRVLVHLEEHA